MNRRHSLASMLLAGALIPASWARDDDLVVLSAAGSQPFSGKAVAVGFEKGIVTPEELKPRMAKGWHGPTSVHSSEVGAYLIVYAQPLITRRGRVEPILNSFEKSGGKRSMIRVDPLP